MSEARVFAIILAGGVGSRMGNMEKPKQFIELGNKPIIIHTIEKFFVMSEFQKVLVLCPRQWIRHTEDLIRRFIPETEKICVIEGGETRNDTIIQGITYIEKEYGLTEEDVIVTHDAVRPFVTHRIIQDNIHMVMEHGACDTVLSATDTIVCSEDGNAISSIPDRTKMYQGQTPQSFRAKRLKEIFMELSEEEKAILTDAAKILVLKGEKVQLVEGEVFNIKITYPFDVLVAKSLLKGETE
ncbi:IspD/TarI family cytidylyltransferase [Anaeromicropila populeti]|uniref:Ribitol-5-phosphate cytidylyltransferase n=1 Tax=Anaeromicropila populeti TaxID=37658 RepID=A0A1I6HWG4_9FIRM|nr:2-C-methyl-D-erythritol 4-phosphate cytidylyltransferase [Anaeromicropila populeti]SFR58767.1 2-C-methyl-D-erythritol 4-phosphate cytidylyltransferase [Anaeromicropila populeti]